MRNPHFEGVLEDMLTVHDRKNEDYADGGNPFSNFEGAAAVAGVSVDTVFQVMIGIKLERLRQLVTNAKTPNHESIDDSILDMTNYAAIWLAYRRSQSETGEGQLTIDDVWLDADTTFSPDHWVGTPGKDFPL